MNTPTPALIEECIKRIQEEKNYPNHKLYWDRLLTMIEIYKQDHEEGWKHD
jgi:hypothetical protein